MKILNKEIKRPYLPQGANIFYVGIDNKFMAEAKKMAQLSNDQQQPVGAVIVYDGQVLDGDYNEAPLSHPFLVKLHQKFCIRHFLGIPTGEHYWMCPGCSSKKNHPEYKISTRLLKKGVPGKPIDVYTWGHWACCSGCCEALAKVPVDNFYLLKDCEMLFDPKKPGNIIGKQFDKDWK